MDRVEDRVVGIGGAWPRLVAGESALAHWFGQPIEAWAPGGIAPFALRRVAEGAPLILEGSAARYVYVVQAGDFKIVRTDEDGYEQVLDFVTRPDIIGFDGLDSGRHVSGAVALEDAMVYAIPAADIESLRHLVPAFDARLQAMFCHQLVRQGDMAWLMAAVGADRRTARFLLQQSRRMAERGLSAQRLHLRMSRRDIASHIGLAHESISRSLTLLAEMGVLHVKNRDVEILDAARLEAFSRCTRGAVELASPTPHHAPQRTEFARAA